MQGLLFITKNSLKKKKGDVMVLLALVSLAAILLYTSISVLLGMEPVLDGAYEKAHTADFLYMTNAGRDRLSEIFTSQEEVDEYEESHCMYLQSVNYRKEGETEKSQMAFIFGKLEEERKIGKVSGTENKSFSKQSIFLPYYMKAAEGYALGDTCYITIGETEYPFTVEGFVEDPLFATPLNINCYVAYISEECFEELMGTNEAAKAARYTQYKMRLKPGEDSFDFDKKISSVLTSDMPELSDSLNIGVNWEMMKGGVSMMSRISMGIILVFSLLLMVVVLIIIRFSIHNSMEMNRKNIGILMAAGYTTRQLNMTAVMEMCIVTFFGATFGIALGILCSGFIGGFQGIMLGISWNRRFHGMSAALTAVTVFTVVILVAYCSGRIYRKISVLHALRGGIESHNFKRNHFPFEKTHLPINLVLSGKNIFGEKKKNLSVLFVVILLAFSTCTGFGIYENFVLDNELLLKMVGVDFGDLILTGGDLEEAGKELGQWEEVEDVLYGSDISIQLASGSEKTECTCNVWREPELLRNEMLVSGRLPKYQNEIVLSVGIADILQVKEGDTVYVTGQRERMPYVVSGIDQKINNMGLKAMLSEEGAKWLNGGSQVLSVRAYMKEGADIAGILDRAALEFPDVEVSDSKLQMESLMGGISTALMAICVVFVLITVFVVAIVEILLVKSKITRERKHFGLHKAVGFTTGQLIGQTMMMNLPVIGAGALAGVFFGTFLMEPLVVLSLSFCGIKSCPFTINGGWLVLTVFGILAVAGAASFLAAIKIRKIEPVVMLAEE